MHKGQHHEQVERRSALQAILAHPRWPATEALMNSCIRFMHSCRLHGQAYKLPNQESECLESYERSNREFYARVEHPKMFRRRHRRQRSSRSARRSQFLGSPWQDRPACGPIDDQRDGGGSRHQSFLWKIKAKQARGADTALIPDQSAEKTGERSPDPCHASSETHSIGQAAQARKSGAQ